MFISDLLTETVSALASNKARTALTVLGIVIGIGSVIAMVAIGSGTQETIKSSISSLGSNLITVMPGGGRNSRGQVSFGRGSTQSLKSADAEAIAALPDVAAVSPEATGRYQVTAATGNNTNVSVTGAGPNYLAVHNSALAEGSFIADGQIDALSKVAVLGATTSVDLFGEGVSPIGQTIRINRISFKVIGLLEPKGGSGMSSPDEMIYVPITALQRFLTGNDYLGSIAVSATDESVMPTLKQAITDELMTRHNVTADNPDFYIMSMDDVLSTMSDVTGTFTLLLACIAGISLLVGGIGIMNMMLTTVTERTREIGLRKALGAKKSDISNQFLAESLLLTFIGGAFGLLLGWSASEIINRLAGLATSITPQSVALAVIVCAAIGIIFGYYPARRAASLKPIVALRHE